MKQLDGFAHLCEHMFVFSSSTSSATDRRAHQTPWDAVRVETVIPVGWTVDAVEDGLRVLERIRREVEAAAAALVTAMPDTRDAVTSLARITGTSAAEARRRRCVAAIMNEHPVVAGLFRTGLLSSEHIAALAPIRAHADDVNAIAVWAVGRPPEDLRHEVEQMRLSHTAGDDTAARQQALRRLVLGAGPEGMITIHGLLAPREGAMLESLLRTLMDANWRHNHPERAPRLGDHGGDSRDQRRLDALLQLLGILPSPLTRPPATPGDERDREHDSEFGPATDFARGHDPHPTVDARSGEPHNAHTETDNVKTRGCETHNDDARRGSPPIRPVADLLGNHPVTVRSAKPAVVIVFDVDRYEAEILGHGPIPVTADLFDPLRNDLYAYYQGADGAILKFARMRREPTLLQRLAIEVRDRHCIFPYCRAPASRCHVHHLNEWLLDHGFTDVEVLGLFCDAHHRHLHVEELKAHLEADGTVTILDRTTGEVIARATKIDR